MENFLLSSYDNDKTEIQALFEKLIGAMNTKNIIKKKLIDINFKIAEYSKRIYLQQEDTIKGILNKIQEIIKILFKKEIKLNFTTKFIETNGHFQYKVVIDLSNILKLKNSAFLMLLFNFDSNNNYYLNVYEYLKSLKNVTFQLTNNTNSIIKWKVLNKFLSKIIASKNKKMIKLLENLSSEIMDRRNKIIN